MVLGEFDPVTILNKEILIRYFWKGLRLFIRPQLDTRGQKLDSWEEVVEKTFNVEAKTLLQLLSDTREIDSRCACGNRLAKKEEKDSRMIKSNTTLFANVYSGKH